MLRLLYVSVRGHKILLGGPTLDADAPVPDGVGIGFPTLAAIKQHVSTELRGLSAYWQVQVVDETGTLIHRGFRTGHNGTGEHWTWQPVVHEGDTALRPAALGGGSPGSIRRTLLRLTDAGTITRTRDPYRTIPDRHRSSPACDRYVGCPTGRTPWQIPVAVSRLPPARRARRRPAPRPTLTWPRPAADHRAVDTGHAAR